MNTPVEVPRSENTAPPLRLRVANAANDDPRHAIGQVHADDLAFLGASDGDTVLFRGKKESYARLRRAQNGTIESGTIQIGRILRENIGASLGDLIELQTADLPASKVLILVPLSSAWSAKTEKKGGSLGRLRRLFGKVRETYQGPSPALLTQILDGTPVHDGDRLRLSASGRIVDYRVLETEPMGGSIVHSDTAIRLAVDEKLQERSLAVSYDDVGGLTKEVARVREMVELPLRHPELFQQLGIDPPKGILFHGPPGCGKTLIARAVAHEAGCQFISVNGPEIIQQHYGESEAHLRKIFEVAQDYPASIIFLDEIDAIAPNRDAVLGDVEKRVVAQLLALMDGLNARGQLIVIAATNLPNAIDPALRRPGRFDREVAISPPNKDGRLEILRIHTRHMPLASDVDLQEVAARTHGFLGADLAALCREAAMLCARDAAPRLAGAGLEATGAQSLAALRVEMGHFEDAQGEIDLSTMREVISEIPDVTWADVGGLDDVRQTLRDVIELPLRHASRFQHAAVRPPQGILLTGAPGTGKTLVAKAMAAESGVNFISVKGPELLSKWVGESEKGLREIFKKARQAAPSIVFFDEIDTILPARGRGDGSGQVAERMVGQFLLEMDTLDQARGVVVLGASNRPDLIDRALIRPGRFDYVIDLPIPDEAGRRAILQVHCRNRNVAPDVDIADIARQTDGLTGADLDALCRRAAISAIRDSIVREPGNTFSAFSVHRHHFDGVLEMAWPA